MTAPAEPQPAPAPHGQPNGQAPRRPIPEPRQPPTAERLPSDGVGRRSSGTDKRQPATGGSPQPPTGAGRQPADGARHQPGNGTDRRSPDGAGRQPRDGDQRQPANGASRQPANGAGRQPRDGDQRQPASGASRRPANGAGRRSRDGAGRHAPDGDRRQAGNGGRPQPPARTGRGRLDGADRVPPGEDADPYCLSPADADRLLAGAPWRRFAVLGDGLAAAGGDGVPGYQDAGWGDRVAAALARRQPDLEYTNVAEPGPRTAEVRASQLGPVLAFRPDLALVVAGSNDILRRDFDRGDDLLTDYDAIVTALQEAGADVVTATIFDVTRSPRVPASRRAPLRRRLEHLAGQIRLVARARGTLHLDLAEHSGRERTGPLRRGPALRHPPRPRDRRRRAGPPARRAPGRRDSLGGRWMRAAPCPAALRAAAASGDDDNASGRRSAPPDVHQTRRPAVVRPPPSAAPAARGPRTSAARPARRR